jgi:hydrogenase expression/formation protein HypE
VTAAGARPGDAVLLTKGPAIEATGLLAILYESELRQRYGDRLAQAALARRDQITVVKDALVARAAGPVTAMHDATEGGVLGGLWEIASASGTGMEIDESAMLQPEDVAAVCEMLAIDPLAAIAEGTLLVTVPQVGAAAVLGALRSSGIAATEIGTVTADPQRRLIRRRSGRTEELAVPREDPFWPAFFRGVERLGKS